MVGIVFLRGQRVESAPSTSRERDVGLGTLLRPGYLLVPLMMFLSGIACMPTQNYLVALVRDELDYGVAAAANIWKTIGFIGMFGGFLMGVVADRITVRWALVMSYGLLSLSLLCFLHHPGLTVIYAGAAIFGLAFNAIFGLLPAYVSLVFPRHLTAAIFGLGNVMLGLGAMAGNFLGGFIKDGTGSFHLVYLGALVATAFLFGLAFMLRKPVIVDAQHAAT